MVEHDEFRRYNIRKGLITTESTKYEEGEVTMLREIDQISDKYAYTVRLEQAFEDQTLELPAILCRKALKAKYDEVKKARGDTRLFKMLDLDEMCHVYGLRAEQVMKDPTLLDSIPTLEEIQQSLPEQLGKILFSLYHEAPSAEEYMERLVRRLAPEYAQDTVRTAILKKFLAGGDILDGDAILAWEESQLDSNEKIELTTLSLQERRKYLISKVNDSVFPSLRPGDVLELIQKILKNLDKKEIVDSSNVPCNRPKFRLLDDQKMKSLCEKYEIDYTENTEELLPLLGCKLVLDDLVALERQLRNEFIGFLLTFQYRNKKNNIVLAKEQFEQDCKDRLKKYKKALSSQAKDFTEEARKLLSLCDDLACGTFRTDGNTREYLYWFAIVFGMTVNTADSAARRDDTDIQKNLFEDFYSDNMIRFLDKTEKKGIESEPIGDGIDFKDYREIIYLYYLHNRTIGQSAAELIQKAQALITECAAEKQWRCFVADGTQAYRKLWVKEIVNLPENQLKSYIQEHFSPLSKPEQRTAFAEAGMSILELQNAERFSSERSWKYSQEEKNIKLKRIFRKEAVSERFAPGWPFGEFLLERYGNNHSFSAVVRKMNQRLEEPLFCPSDRDIEDMVVLLRVLSLHSTKDKPLSIRKMRTLVGDLGVYLDGRQISDCLSYLKKIGFPCHYKVYSNGRDSIAWIQTDDPVGMQQRQLLELLGTSLFTYADQAVTQLKALIQPTLEKRITRTQFLALITYDYLAALDGDMLITNFSDVIDDYISQMNNKLQEARFQPFSVKNILDMYVILSVYYNLAMN